MCWLASKLVGSGRFYRGLYTFVSGTQVMLPPLRERVGDIEYLALNFLDEFRGENKSITFSQDSMNKLVSHYWTHNIQELKSINFIGLLFKTTGDLGIPLVDPLLSILQVSVPLLDVLQ